MKISQIPLHEIFFFDRIHLTGRSFESTQVQAKCLPDLRAIIIVYDAYGSLSVGNHLKCEISD